MSTYFIQCLHWWKFQWFIRSKFIKFCNHRCKSIRSHIRVLFNPIMISVAYIKLPTSTSIVAGNFFLCFVYKDVRSIRSNILCIFYCITISRNTRLCHVTFSRVIGMPQYSALLSRRALTLGLSVLMGEVVLGRLESMHQHRMCPHYYCIPVDFCLIIVFLKSVVQAISVKLHGFLYLSRSRRTIKVNYYVDS